MSLALRLANVFSLTILNGVTASLALGSAYLAHVKPDLVSPIDAVQALTTHEDSFLRARFQRLGFEMPEKTITFYKAPVKRASFASIGLVGSPSRAHIYVPTSYLLPPTASFDQAYPRMLEGADVVFKFKDRTLEESNQSQEFQDARAEFMAIEPVFPESFEEMDMSLKNVALKLKMNTEKEIIWSGVACISALTVIHQAAAFMVKPVGLFPLLPCAFGIGAMVYKGWKTSDEIIDLLGDTPQNAAILAHQTSAELAYNKERRKFIGAPEKYFLTQSGNDWLHELLTGPTSRRHAIAQNTLLTQIYISQEDTEGMRTEIEKHFKRPGSQAQEDDM